MPGGHAGVCTGAAHIAWPPLVLSTLQSIFLFSESGVLKPMGVAPSAQSESMPNLEP